MDSRSLEAVWDGSARGPRAAATRVSLSIASLGYRLGRTAHRGLYAVGLRRRVTLPRPVVSIGNLTAGGVGKTPFVAACAARLQQRGITAVVLARGYGRSDGESLNDEGKWLVDRVPGLTVLQDPDRVAIATRFLADGGVADVFLLDDGFQHERLSRDVDVVLVDATRPFGYGHHLPRGLLRDPPSALCRAHIVVLTRCELATDEALERLEESIRAHAPDVPIGRVRFAVRTVTRGGESHDVSRLSGRRVWLLTAVGHPASVVATLEACGATVVGEHRFPDHHRFTAEEWSGAVAAAATEDAVLVTTEKDAVKQPMETTPSEAPWVLRQSVEWVAGEQSCWAAWRHVVAGA